MSTRKTLTAALTATALVTGISLAWAQAEEQAPQTNSTTATGAMPSEQTPADPNAVPLTGNTATQQQQTGMPNPAALPQQSGTTNPPAVNGSTAAPLSSDANSQSTSNTTGMNNRNVDTGASTTTSADINPNSGSTYEPAPRADRN